MFFHFNLRPRKVPKTREIPEFFQILTIFLGMILGVGIFVAALIMFPHVVPPVVVIGLSMFFLWHAATNIVRNRE